MSYEPIIGLEVHIELATKSKMFCTCSADYFGAKPNTHTCPICLGLPGALPKPNLEAIKFTQKLGLVLNCKVQMSSKFDRKNYFYPDLPKGFQISQYDLPFSKEGSITVQSNEKTKKIRITRAHLEEDTAKLAHATVGGRRVSLIDFNRSGVPLVEIVTEPDINSAQEAKIYAQKLQQIVRYLEISDADMEKGSMRIEPNVSLRKVGETSLPSYKVELKNINSFKFAQNAVEYEIKRQSELLNRGQQPQQETRGWSEAKQITLSQRTKEFAHDYRYFPEPDLVPFVFNKSEIDKLRNKIPELPDQKLARFIGQYHLSMTDAQLLTQDLNLANFFEEAQKAYKGEPKKVANWVYGELLRRLNETGNSVDQIDLLPASLAELLYMVDSLKITIATAKEIFAQMINTGKTATELVKEQKIKVMDDVSLKSLVEKVIAANQKAVVDYKQGKVAALQFLIGQVQRQTHGQTPAARAKELLEAELL